MKRYFTVLLLAIVITLGLTACGVPTDEVLTHEAKGIRYRIHTGLVPGTYEVVKKKMYTVYVVHRDVFWDVIWNKDISKIKKLGKKCQGNTNCKVKTGEYYLITVLNTANQEKNSQTPGYTIIPIE